ncbi:MAG: hypothetical protein GXY06_07235 [Clostridiaceae bacterium]|nr:hypothetical protein [Clostridiaceae bacterium]
MSKFSSLGVFLNLYWKVTWKWFLGLVAGMAALELGLLLFYINGGHQYLFFREQDKTKYWPAEYRGALQSIRMSIILPIIAVLLILFLILIFYSLNNVKSSKLTMRIPVTLEQQTLYKLVHSLSMVVSVWLVQFLLLIIGFLIYRSSAPTGININAQLYMIFAPPGLISVLYPITNIGYLVFLLPELLILSIFPVYISDMIQKTGFPTHYVPSDLYKALAVTITIVILSFQINESPSLLRTIIVLVLMALVLLTMIHSLFSGRTNISVDDYKYISDSEE